MSLITTCPACGTAFRISAEQLAAHRGDVRCGRCQHIFSALRHLTEVPISAEPNLRQPPPASPESASAPLPTESADALMVHESLAAQEQTYGNDRMDEAAGSPPADLPADSIPWPAATAAGEPSGIAVDAEAALSRIEADALGITTESPAGLSPVEIENVDFETVEVAPTGAAAPLSSQENAAPPVEPPPSVPIEAETPVVLPAEQTAETEPEAPSLHIELLDYTGQPEVRTMEEHGHPPGMADSPELVEGKAAAAGSTKASAHENLPAAAAAPFSRRRRSMPLWLGLPLALLLALAAAAQIAYFMRTELSARFPQLRPVLVSACATLGCTVELPRKPELLGIEDSDLQADPDHGGVLVLSATLYNRAPYRQAYPLLELTLTDTFDQPVLRRTLTAKEYLPAATAKASTVESGIPANGEVSLRLNLGVTDIQPAGYRLYLKY